MPQNMQYVDGRMELRTNFNIIHGALGGELSSEVIWQCVRGECKLYPCEL